MTHDDLIDLGFKLYGVEEDDPFYKIIFKYPFKFGIQSLSGALEDDHFWLYGNDVKYSDKNELKKVIDVVGSEIYE
jgi:hypothetical protein